jgi:photosystem II stability/assembly factor-like uncharacterized protein
MKTKTLLITAIVGLFQLSANAQWTDLTSPISNDLNSVDFTDANNGWAVGRQGKVIHTTNGGTSWTEQNSSTTEDLNKIFMVSNSVGYAVGNKGIVLKYTGIFWVKVDINYTQTMMGVYFLDANTGWVSGDWGRIMKTTDGGQNWTTEMNNSIYTNQFNDLYMFSETEGWAVGSFGRVLKYNGTNWVNFSYSNPDNDAINAVHFNSSDDGFMVGENSTVFHYDGSSWTQQNTSLASNDYHVTDVVSIDANTAYLTANPGYGGAGTILKYNGNTWSKDYEYTGMYDEFFDGMTFVGSKGFTVGAGGGIKTMGAGSGSNGIAEEKSNKTNLYPNPFVNNTNIRYSLTENAAVNIKLFDITGRAIATLVNQNQAAGDYVFNITGTKLENGVYFVQKTINNSTETIKLIKE